MTDCRASFVGIRTSSDMARASLLVVRDARKCSYEALVEKRDPPDVVRDSLSEAKACVDR